MSRKIIIKTSYGSYSCLFEQEKDMGGYSVEAIDMPGAISWGKNFIEAKTMITEAIEGLIESRVIANIKKNHKKLYTHKKLISNKLLPFHYEHCSNSNKQASY